MNMERKHAAILSADVQDYSYLMGKDEVGTVRTLMAYRETMTMFIQQHRGRVVDAPGDNLLAEFASVVSAIQCAVEIQRELKTQNAELRKSRRLEFRIGINLGEIIVHKERIYGDGVNIAARVETMAIPGGVTISSMVYDQVEGKLALGYEDLGEHTVKNIIKPVHVYRVLIEPGAEPAAPARSKPGGRARPRKALISVAAFVLMVGVGTTWWHSALKSAQVLPEAGSEARMAFPLSYKPSIAVLPFSNLSVDAEQEYFADGMTKDLITGLSKIKGLFVIASNSTRTYKGKLVKLQQVAAELGVRYVLEGSVQRVRDQVRINAQLVDAVTGMHLWAERYDGSLADTFVLQEKVTRKIVTALVVRLTADESRAAREETNNNVHAYDPS